MKAESTTLTHDVMAEKADFASKQLNVHHVIDFTFPVGSFMLKPGRHKE